MITGGRITHLCLFYCIQQVLVAITGVAVAAMVARLSTASETPDTVSAVSGLYGPGSFVAWVLTSVSAIGHSFQFTDSPTPAPDFDCIDGELLAAMAYPLVGAADATKRIFQGSHGASLDAAIRVAYWGWGFSFFAVCLTTRRTQRRTRWRSTAWSVVWYTSNFAVFVTRITPSTAVTWWQISMLLVMTWILTRYQFPTYMERTGKWKKTITLAVFTILLWLGVIFFGRGKMTWFPLTASHLSDLDQASALGLGIIATVLSVKWRDTMWAYAQRLANWRTGGGSGSLP